MPISVPLFPDAGALSGADFFYLLQGGGLDRDRKITIAKLREFLTAQGVRLLITNLAGPANQIVNLDITGTTNVVVLAIGAFLAPSKALNITGQVPDGCSVTVVSGVLGYLDFRVNGVAQANTPEELDFGWKGRAEMVWSDTLGAFVTTIVNDSQWNRNKLTAAVATETTRAQTAEGNLASMIQGEATQRQDDITQTQALIAAEVDRATSAENNLSIHRSRLEPQTVVLWTNTDIYSQGDNAITARGPATVSTSGVGVNGEAQLVIEGADSNLMPADVHCWRPTGTSGPIMGAGNTLSTKFQTSIAAATGIAVTGGSPTSRVAMLSWFKSLGKIVVEKLPGSTVTSPAATIGLLLPVRDDSVFEELLVRVIVGDDVSCEVIVQHPTNGHGLEIPAATINDGHNWWIRARHLPGEDWKMDCWWEPKRM